MRFIRLSRRARKLFLLVFVASVLTGGLFALRLHQIDLAAVIFARGKVKAALTAVTLNNGNGNVIIGNDVTSQTTALTPDIGAYRWTRDGSNFAVFNMPFNSGGSQSDFSGNTNTGTIVGGAAHTDTGCKVGGCMTFNGTNAYINAGSGSSVQIGGANRSFSVEGWIKRSADGHADFIMNQGPAASNTSLHMGYRVTNEFTFAFYNNDLNTAVLADAGGWHHWVGTYDGVTNERRLYRDGVLAANDVAAADYTGSGDMIIGAVLAGPVYVAGSLDEVRIYTTVLTPAQITQHYTDGLGASQNAADGIGGPTIIKSTSTTVGQLWNLSITPITTAGAIGSAVSSSNVAVITSGISSITGSLNNPDEGSPIISTLTIPGSSTAGYRWLVNSANLATFNIPFNTGGTHSDISGTANHGTPQGGAAFTMVGCKVGGCLSLDGVDDYVSIVDEASLNLTGSQSFSAWIKPSSLGAQNVVYGRWGPTDHQTLLDVASGVIRYSIRTPAAASVTRSSTVTATTGTWYHVVGVYNSALSTLDIYVNGALANGALSGVVTSSLRSPTVGVPSPRIGFKGDGTTTEFFAGLIDEAQLYPRALSAAQINQLYQDGNAGVGGPTRIGAQEHVLNQSWDLIATEFLGDGSMGPAAFIDNTTIAAVSTVTTLGITTPSGSQAGNITVNYTCANPGSLQRDFLVEFSTNGGGAFSTATLVSASSGIVGNGIIGTADCASGTSNNSLVWNSLANGVTTSATVQVRITAQYTGGPSATTTNFTVANPTNLCTAGGEAAGGLTAAETSFDGTAVSIINCTLSIDGAHSFSSFTLGDGIGSSDSVLTQSDTTSTTVFRTTLTVSGATTINADGLVNLDGKGFLPDYTSDGLGGATTVGASSDREGGSHGGRGGTDSVGDSSGTPYDSISQPNDPGGGGGATGDGGGYIKITTAGFAHHGIITANGTTGANGAGAGGGVWIIATGQVTGSGTIRTNGVAANSDDGSGAGGRIALHYNAALPGNNAVSLVFQAFGGDNTGSTDFRGGAGTVYLEKTNVHAAGQGDVIIANNNVTITVARITPIPAVSTFADVTIKDRAVAQAATLNVANLTLQNSATLQHDFTTTTTVFRLNITATNTVSIDSTSSINILGRGFVAGYTTNGAGGTTNVGGTGDRSGGSHGGRGGTDSVGDDSIAPFDSITQPADPGAGSGPQSSAGSGGGYVKISTANLALSGTVNANGLTGANGSGAGGGVWIIVTGQITGAGTVQANGAVAGGTDDGSGGGGRIAVHYNSSVSGNDPLPITLQAFGGTNAGSTDFRGGAGTVYLERTNVHTANQGEIIVANNSVAVTEVRSAPITDGTYDTLRVLNNGNVRNTGTLTFQTVILDVGARGLFATLNTGTLTMSNSSVLTHDVTTASVLHKLFINATTVTINTGTLIDVDARGFVKGTTSNGAGGITTVGAVGDRSGGSHGGRGGTDSVGDDSIAPFDSISQPADPGSGAGPQSAGGSGGGYVKIVTTGFTNNGTISANGGFAANGTGAGGGIWIVATGQVAGTGTIRANGSSSNDPEGAGGGGRIALHYDSSQPGNEPLSLVFQAFGGSNNASTDRRGGAGTVYVEKTNTHVAGQGNVTVANNSVSVTAIRNTVFLNNAVFADVTIKDRGIAQADTFTAANLNILTSGILQHDFTTTSVIKKLIVTVSGATTIDGTGSINLDGRGFTPNRTSNGLGGSTTTGASGDRSGGSHGGRGGSDSVGDDSGVMYDTLTAPTEPGAGGGVTGVGGGYAKITTVHFAHSGTITADGTTGANGSGAGGGLWIITTGQVSGSGTMRANGAAASDTTDGSGGGGRIAFYYDGSVPGNSTLAPIFQTFGGANTAASDRVGGAGTIFIKDTTQTNGDLRVDNTNLVTNSARATRLFVTVPAGLPTTYTFRNLSVINRGQLLIDSPCAGTPALTVTGTTDLSGSGTITNNQSGTCTVSQNAINVTTTSLPTGIVGTAYSQQIASTGGYGPHTFVCRSGGVTVACTTVLPAGLDMTSAGVVSGTPTTPGTTLFTVRATEAAPGVGFDEETISLTIGNAPTAPTNLFSNSTDAQLCCSSATTDASPVFSAIFNDPDSGNTSSKFRIQVASDVGFTTLLWDSGASGTAMSSCAAGARCANINYAGSVLTLGAVTYHWRIKYWDNTDLEGPFSGGATFVTSQSPTAPTNLFSNDSSAQAGLTNPVGVNAGRPIFSARYNDPDIGDVATKYRIQVDNNNNFSSLVWDSGAAGTSMSNCSQGLRCADITFGGTTPLELDETVYFWRIKFFDAAGIESPWSEDPVATNKFTMGIASSNTQQQVVVQNTVPNTPRAGTVQVIDSTTLRYNWADLSNNETGFRLIDDQGNVIKEVAAGITSAEETNLPVNTPVSGRRVVAFNGAGVSQPSEPFTTTVTAMPAARPVLVRRGGNSVTFTITPAPENLSEGSTGILFELIVRPSDPTQPMRTLTSDWQKITEYTFTGINPADQVEVRIVTRNQTGYANEPTEYLEVEELSRHFSVNIHVVKKGTNLLPRPIPPQDVVSVVIRLRNTGTQAATNVFARMALPQYIRYQFGTLVIDGRTATDFADEDVAQTTDRDISAIWPRISANEEHTIAFDLTFDQAALSQWKQSASASANPVINLQMTVGFAESDALFTSPIVALEPDLAFVAEEPAVEEQQPVREEPVPAPTQQDVDEVAEILNQFIQQEAEQGQPSSGEAAQPSGPQTQTTTSSDGPSFNIDVTRTDGNTLSVTGYAQPDQDQIEFSGTTSQPNALVTLIFNGNVTVLVTSDENGNWRTFVSAAQLGIAPGQKAEITIEAIAAKGDLRSDRVQVGRVTVGLESTGDIAAEFETTVSAAPIVTVINEVRKQVAIAIEKQEPAIQRTLATTAPVVLISSAPLWGYLPYLPTMIYHAFTYLVGLIGRKKKQQQRFYGIVYDSINKQPLALAIIRIYNKETNKLVATQVSDKQGRYEALLEPAAYRLEVTKPTYTFPSAIVTGEMDGSFQHVYHNEQGLRVQAQEIIVPDVPLDPVNAERQWQATHGFKKVWFAVQKVGNYLAVPVLMIGALASIAVVMTIPENPLNWLLVFVYVFMLGAQVKLRPKVQKAWGVVYDIASNAVLPLATIQLIDPQYGKVVTSRLTDYQGRYSFLPEPGKYVIKTSKPGYEQIKEIIEAPKGEHHPIPEQVAIEKANQTITGDVPMKAVS